MQTSKSTVTHIITTWILLDIIFQLLHNLDFTMKTCNGHKGRERGKDVIPHRERDNIWFYTKADPFMFIPVSFKILSFCWILSNLPEGSAVLSPHFVLLLNPLHNIRVLIFKCCPPSMTSPVLILCLSHPSVRSSPVSVSVCAPHPDLLLSALISLKVLFTSVTLCKKISGAGPSLKIILREEKCQISCSIKESREQLHASGLGCPPALSPSQCPGTCSAHSHHQPHAVLHPLCPSSCHPRRKEQGRQPRCGALSLLPPKTLCLPSKGTVGAIATWAAETWWGVWLPACRTRNAAFRLCRKKHLIVWLIFCVPLWSTLQSPSPWPSTACFLSF